MEGGEIGIGIGIGFEDELWRNGGEGVCESLKIIVIVIAIIIFLKP
tara:strand:- start:706 stop:843 length:138 start_codon:yes stop_codon:yes gene_type:complete